MLSKELFIKRMQLIDNFRSEQDTLEKLIEKLTDGYAVATIGNYLIDVILDTINEQLNIKDDYLLFWWLYEDVNKVIYIKEDEIEKEISVKTLEELYDYIIDNYPQEQI